VIPIKNSKLRKPDFTRLYDFGSVAKFSVNSKLASSENLKPT
jgi:hypothetical protein